MVLTPDVLWSTILTHAFVILDFSLKLIQTQYAKTTKHSTIITWAVDLARGWTEPDGKFDCELLRVGPASSGGLELGLVIMMHRGLWRGSVLDHS